MSETVSLEEFTTSAGRSLGPSAWLLIDQPRVDQFAAATDDFQFIHVDPEKAGQSPFRGTVAHGFLTLSLLSHLNQQNMILPERLVMTINYGSDKVRYLQPVRVGARVRTHQKILEVSNKNAGRWLVRRSVWVEIENQEKAALSAEILSMYVVAQAPRQVGCKPG